MAITPEHEAGEIPKKVPDGVKEIPDTPEIPPAIERGGVKTVPTQVTAQVTDDSGQQLIQTPATKKVTITIPADQGKLQDWSKGSPADALTWLGAFWIRMIKKALHFGWKIFKRGGGN
jgi:hypothetical protein